MLKKIFSTIMLAILVVGLTACQPTVDTSSEKAFNQSTDEIYNSLEGKEKNQFKAAMQKVMLAAAFSSKDKRKKMFEELDGMTASELIQAVNK